MLPTFVVMVAILGLPLLFSLHLSFTGWSPNQALLGSAFVGFDNYADLFADPVFVGSLGITFGYIWSGMMFFSAALNIVLALSLDVTTWAAVKSVWAIGSKVGLFLIQYAVMKSTGIRRARAMMASA